MDKNGFYVTLPSNASLLVYPNNKIWNYRTKLAKTIVLREPHEVGLIEIQYPKMWNSFNDSDASIQISYDITTGDRASIVMTVGYYGSIEELVYEFNVRIRALTKKPYKEYMYYDSFKNRVYISGLANRDIVINGRLAEILGFVPSTVFPTAMDPLHRNYAPHAADIHGGCYNIYVYSDIVDYQLVGDSHVPLLRCINVSDEVRRIPTLTFDKPHYTSLSKTVFDDIELALKDDQNRYIPFLYGKVIVKLHFRPIKQYF